MHKCRPYVESSEPRVIGKGTADVSFKMTKEVFLIIDARTDAVREMEVLVIGVRSGIIWWNDCCNTQRNPIESVIRSKSLLSSLTFQTFARISTEKQKQKQKQNKTKQKNRSQARQYII